MQTNTSFSISEALSFGWETFKKQPLFWVIVTIITMVIGSLGSFTDRGGSSDPAENARMVSEMDPGIAMLLGLLGLVFMVISMGVQLGAIRLELDAVEGKELKYTTLFSQFDFMKLLKFIVASILYGLLVGIGLLLLVVPGVYFALKYQFYPFFIVTKNAGILESGKLSAEATKGLKLQLLGYCLVAFLIVVAGALALFVGLLVAIPVVSIAYAYVFNKLKSHMHAMPLEASATPPVAQESSAPVMQMQ